ncbi:DUF4124 domain-containing protein [Marinobacter shengliensis]|uniref:DUF4124 domain-containing protein n=1 Tax=Marinobacter shengliensis TaxID=1389223 RepID=UPI001E2E6058|nr:DUF4124 domain-containing protein [Marinobacter shengliensis]MCD1631347.1 DUF4124 domain-containing protein [Marinobacter shengliensis]
MRFLALLLISLSFTAVAQVYTWTDENGVTHFGTQPPPGAREEVQIRDTRIGTVPPSQPEIESKSGPRQSSATTLSDLERSAAQKACNLAKSELSSAERKLTLSLSIDQTNAMADYRRNQVDLWQRRVRIECIGVE